MADETKIPGTVEEPAPPGGPPAPEQPEITTKVPLFIPLPPLPVTPAR